MSGELTIYGDLRSGNCHKVRWTARHLGVPFQWIARVEHDLSIANEGLS